MLDERSTLDQERSRYSCEVRYGRYGAFASLPLITAVVETQAYSVSALRSASYSLSRKPSLTEFINRLTYHGKDYFTVEESLFLLQLVNRYGPVTDEQLETDLQDLSNTKRWGSIILDSHAEAVIKAVNFWKMKYNDKYTEWRRSYIVADAAFVARRRAQMGSVARQTRDFTDERYQSGHDSDSDHEG